MLVKYTAAVTLLFTHLAANAVDIQVPEQFDVSYTLHSNDTKIGIMERSLTLLDDGNYLFSSKSKTTGFIALFRKDHIVETSLWKTSHDGYVPISYTYNHTGGKKDRSVKIDFNWEKDKITNRVNDSTWYMDTEEGILDKLLYQLTIMSDLKSGTVPDQYTIADGGKIKQYFFEYLEDEEINTPLGKFKTMKLARHKPNSDKTTWLWCAYELSFLPIKVVNTEKKGRLTTATIKSLNGLGYSSE